MAKILSDEGVINHYGAVRLRVTGSGNLKLGLFSFDKIRINTLIPISMLAKTDVEPNRLANFTQQKAELEIRITEIDETFHISKVIVFVKPVAKSFPEMT